MWIVAAVVVLLLLGVVAYLLLRGRTPSPGGDGLGNKAVFKRLGYLLEAAELPDDGLRDACHERIAGGIVLLDPTAPPRGPRAAGWGIRVNVAVRREQPT